MPTTYEIHPAIGIARVGNSTAADGFFVGPEPGAGPRNPYRDAAGALKRQAARFRVYKCDRDANGNLTAAVELTPATAAVSWTVHPVNRKRASPRFVDQGIVNTDPNNRRNKATGDDGRDKDLILDPGAKTVEPNRTTTKFDLTYQGRNVSLGELRLDGTRLLVLGGFGRAEALTGAPIQGFAENDDWFDDVSDGPVSAAVTLPDGTKPAVKAAWVVVAPPDFAPGIANLVTLYDALYARAVERGLAGKGVPPPPTKPAYGTHIFPILRRAMAYGWVNRYARMNHGPGQKADFTSSRWTGIEDPSPAGDPDLRQDIFGLLRAPAASTASSSFKAMPRLLSNDYPARTALPLTPVQYAILKQWVKGDFVAGTAAPATEPEPDALTRTVLEACVGGAFWPGIEAGRILLDASLYLDKEPFRLDPQKVLPGQLTGSMALPWQADFFDCTWEVDNPDVPQRGMGWWPAQRPDDVFRKGADATDANRTDANMTAWATGINSAKDMVDLWHELGIVVNVGTDTNPDFRETERSLPP